MVSLKLSLTCRRCLLGNCEECHHWIWYCNFVNRQSAGLDLDKAHSPTRDLYYEPVAEAGKDRLLTRHPSGVLRVDVLRCTASGRLRVCCWRAALWRAESTEPPTWV